MVSIMEDEDLSGRIQSILNDEESMRQIKELADMLTSGQTDGQNGNSVPDMSALAGMFGSLAGTSGGSSSSEQDSPFGGMDIGTMMQMGQILSAASAKDPNRDLLLALRPLMKPDKQKKIDTAVKFLKLYAVYETLKEKGMLNKLGDIL
jgi:hypothetical protein